MPKEAQRHHTVPRAYLEYFADTKGQVLQTWLKDGHQHHNSIVNVSVRNDFYTIIDERTGSKDLFWENWLASIEGPANEAFEAINQDGAKSLTQARREALSTWIAVQYVRSHAMRKTFDALVTGTLKAIAEIGGRQWFNDMMQEEGKVFETEKEADEAYELHLRLNDLTVQVSPTWHMTTGSRIAQKLDLRLRAGSWMLLDTENRPFVTSDSPVVLTGSEDSPSVMTAEEVLVPVSRYKAFIIHLDDLSRTGETNGVPNLYEAVDGLIFHSAQEFLITHPEDQHLVDRPLPLVTETSVFWH